MLISLLTADRFHITLHNLKFNCVHFITKCNMSPCLSNMSHCCLEYNYSMTTLLYNESSLIKYVLWYNIHLGPWIQPKAHRDLTGESTLLPIEVTAPAVGEGIHEELLKVKPCFLLIAEIIVEADLTDIKWCGALCIHLLHVFHGSAPTQPLEMPRLATCQTFFSLVRASARWLFRGPFFTSMVVCPFFFNVEGYRHGLNSPHRGQALNKRTAWIEK